MSQSQHNRSLVEDSEAACVEGSADHSRRGAGEASADGDGSPCHDPEVTQDQGVETPDGHRLAQLNAVVEQMTEGLVVFDRHGTLVDMNPAARQMHGFESTDDLRRPLDELTDIVANYDLDGRRLPVEEWPIGRVLRGESFDSYEVRVEVGPSQRRWIGAFGGTMVRDGDGRPLCAIVTVRDVTAYHDAQAALRGSEARFRQLAEAMPQIVWTADRDGRFDYINGRGRELAGMSERDDGTWDNSASVHPDDREWVEAQWAESVASGEVFEAEYRLRLADSGEYRWFLSRGVPVRDESGRITKWFGSSTDIDDTKRAEATLRELDRRKNEFLAMLGHELRNPLAAIANGVRVVQRGGQTAEVTLPMVQRHVDQMTRLLDDLLDISRITRGKLEVDRRVQPLRPILDDAIDSIRPRIDEFGHTLEVGEIPEVAVDADASRLQQIVSNLLDNAASYTRPGGTVRLQVDADEAQVALRVIDNGAGISKERLEMIFEPFVQGDGDHPRGLGIGLALVRRLVELHDGEITARSDGPGTGSEFIVHLPRAADDAVARVSKPPVVDTSHLDGCEVLAVDDNVDAASFMAVLLRDLGCNVDLAATGQEGLALAASKHYDVVLLDIGLPDINGREVARRLRRMPEYAATRFIAISGYTQRDDVKASIDAGFDDHLGKPVSPDALRDAIGGEPPSLDLTDELGVDDLLERDQGIGLAEESSSVLDPPAGIERASSGATDADTELLVALVRQLSHDLRTPLITMSMSGWMLGQGPSGQETRAMGQRIENASVSMTQLTDRAVDLATLAGQGRRALELEPVDAADLVDQALAQLDSAARARVSVSRSDDGPTAGRWDAERLESLLCRLLAHATADADARAAVEVGRSGNRAVVTLSWPAELPRIESGEAIDRLDTLAMDLRYADRLARAHRGVLRLGQDARQARVRIELPVSP